MKNLHEQQLKRNLVYVIDRDFHLVHLSNSAKRNFPHAQLGQTCFSALRNKSAICEDCPWAFVDIESEGSVRNVIYNIALHQWLEISCICVDWPDKGLCVAVAAKSITENNKDSFTQFTQQSIYDELLEVNLNNHTFKILFFEEEKYELPLFIQSLDDIVQLANFLIHPEDRKEFIKFWTPAAIKRKFGQDHIKEARGEFRQKLKTGGYHWTSQTLVPIQRSESDSQSDNMYLCYILDIEEQKNRNQKELKDREKRYRALRERDSLTGLYRSDAFFDKGKELLANHPSQDFEMVCIDMKNFRLFNEWYGREAGDQLLKTIASRLKNARRSLPAIAGYFGADNFAFLMPQNTGVEESLGARIEIPSLDLNDNIGFFPVVGICRIDDTTTSLQTFYDRANIAKSLSKHNYQKTIAWYEESTARQIDDDVKLLLDIQRALEKREFVLYWQPQCDIRSGRIVGLEALVRWRHPQRGLVSPGEFIPLLEKSGFIVNLDLYVWEEVCAQLRRWIDKGINPVAVSVNISQSDVYAIDVPSAVEALVSKYRISRELLKLEITESTFAESGDIANMARRFKTGGFTVLMDDFGSGYSSLNVLKDLDLDVLKIDMDFLDWSEENAARGESIVESVLHMTNLMELRVIAEGVETKEQAEFLLDIGCNYAQGYYFYRPMATTKIEPLLTTKGKVDHGGLQKEFIKIIDFEDLVSNRISNKAVLDIILGGIALYEVSNNHYELVEMNRQYRRLVGDLSSCADKGCANALSFVYPDDASAFEQMFTKARCHTISGAQDIIRQYHSSGELIWVLIKLFYLGNQEGKQLYYGSLTDVSEWKKQQEALSASELALHHSNHALENSQAALNNMLGVFNTGASLSNMSGCENNFTIDYFAKNAPSGFIAFYCEEDYPIIFANDNLLAMLGFETLDELIEENEGLFSHLIHEHDRDEVRATLGQPCDEGFTYLMHYRLKRKDQSLVRIIDQGRLFRDKEGRLASAAAILDITPTVQLQEDLELNNEILKSLVRFTNLDAWVYDIEKDEVTFFNIVRGSLIEQFIAMRRKDRQKDHLVIEHFTEVIHQARRYRQDEKHDIFKLIYTLARGKEIEGTLRVHNRKNEECWLSIDSKIIFDSNHAPRRAIGYLKEIPRHPF